MAWFQWGTPPRASRLAHRYGIGYAQADRIIRHQVWLQWRRFGWLGAIALVPLVADLACEFAGRTGPATPLLLAGASLGIGLQLWLAQRAAWPAIIQEAEDVARERSS